MIRTPAQDRSRARVQRILDAAANMLCEQGQEDITARALAARAKVSLGTIYQFFEDMDAVRHALHAQVKQGLDACLHSDLEADAARADPGGYFGILIDAIERLQSQYPVMGCLVRDAGTDAFQKAFAAELKEYIAAHTGKAFAEAFPAIESQEIRRILLVTFSAVTGALQVTPPRGDPSRGPHLEAVKALARCYVTKALRETKGHSS
jgi:AcrR family transcriptional regulator